mgnify:CR=1 FL=1
MNLTELRPLWAAPIKDVSLPRDADMADRYINLAYIEVFEAHRWAFRKKTGNLLVIPSYTTGTCTVTQYNGTNEGAAKTVTFSGSALTQAMVGRYFRPQSSSYWHKIVYITGNTVTLDTPIVDIVSAGGLTFEIWKRFSYVKSDVDVIYDFDRWADSKLSYNSESKLVDEISDTTTSGTPSRFAPFGIDPYDDVEYSTGTIALAVNSNVLVGSTVPDTAWLSSGFDTGDMVEINNKFYWIKRVETDNRIVLFNSYNGTNALAAGTSYAFHKYNPLGFQFYNPTDANIILPYTYLCRAFPLIHVDDDRIQFTRRFIPAIISRAVYFRLKDTVGFGNSASINALQIYKQELQGLKEKNEVVDTRYDQFSPKIPTFMPGRG